MTRLTSTELAIQIAEHRAKTRDDTRIRLAQLEQTNEDLKERLQHAECMRDNYRDRCPVLASDVGPEHTAARVLAYALANGWEHVPYVDQEPDPRDMFAHYAHVNATNGALLPIRAYESNEVRSRATPIFCMHHAQASGMAPLDVLAAIGAMP